jgi:putative membrane protein
MLWVKSLHVIFIVSWFAGLFYLPRLYVNLAIETEPAARARLLTMARKLFRFTTILAIPAVLFGLWLFVGYGIGLHGPGNGWMHAKLALVVCVIGYHHACGSMLRRFERGGAAAAARSERFYRVFNESAVLLLAAIVVLVIVKPF